MRGSSPATFRSSSRRTLPRRCPCACPVRSTPAVSSRSSMPPGSRRSSPHVGPRTTWPESFPWERRPRSTSAPRREGGSSRRAVSLPRQTRRCSGGAWHRAPPARQNLPVLLQFAGIGVPGFLNLGEKIARLPFSFSRANPVLQPANASRAFFSGHACGPFRAVAIDYARLRFGPTGPLPLRSRRPFGDPTLQTGPVPP